jgi:hypothetical protein
MATDLSFLTLLEGLQRLELPRLALTERPTLCALCRLQGLRVLDMSMHCFRWGLVAGLQACAAGRVHTCICHVAAYWTAWSAVSQLLLPGPASSKPTRGTAI